LIKTHLKLVVIIILMFLLAACEIHMDLWVNKDGSGHGAIKLINVPMANSQVQKQSLEEHGFRVISVDAEDASKVTYMVEWDDFNKSFESRTVNKDGTVMLDFGAMDGMVMGSLIVHVPGKIITTTGKVTKGNTVTFKSGRATVTYKPSIFGSCTFVLILMFLFGLAAIIVLVIFIKRKKTRKDDEKPEEGDK